MVNNNPLLGLAPAQFCLCIEFQLIGAGIKSIRVGDFNVV